jgi:hypothetical protein
MWDLVEAMIDEKDRGRKGRSNEGNEAREQEGIEKAEINFRK